MKLLTFLFLLTSTSAQAQFNWFDSAFLEQGNFVSLTLLGQNTGVDSGSVPISDSSPNQYVGGVVIPSVSGSVNYCDLYLQRQGTLSANLTVQIWTYNNSTQIPLAALGTLSASVSFNSIPTTTSLVRFSGLGGASVTSGTKYYVLISCDTTDASNFIKWHYTTVSSPGYFIEYIGSAPTTMTSQDTGRSMTVNVYQ